MSTGELACTYAALILHDDGNSVTPEKITMLLKSAKVTVESYWPTLFAKLLEKRSVDDLILSAGSAGAGAPVAAAAADPASAAAAADAAPAAEEKKEEKDESEDEDLGFGLFD